MADFAMLFGGKKEGGKRPLPFGKSSSSSSDEGEGGDWKDEEEKPKDEGSGDLERASKLLVRALGMNPADVDLEGVGEALRAVYEAC